MTYEEATRKIRYIKDRILKLKRELKKKENDYEELVALRRGLDNVLDGFSKARSRDKAAMSDPVLKNNRSLKMFREYMLDSMNAQNRHLENIILASEKVYNQSRKTILQINSIEDEITRLQRELRYYQAMANRILAEQRQMEG